MRSFFLGVAALLPAFAPAPASAACSGYQFECDYVPGEPDRRPLRDQLQRPIWAPEPPVWPTPERQRMAQPDYGLPSPNFTPQIGDRSERSAPRPRSDFRAVEPPLVPVPLERPLMLVPRSY
jgi:hypothetical protein